MARRLEHVRNQGGFATLKDLWRRMVEVAGEEAPSYASVRTYHHDREPPVSYMVLISDITGVSVDWLVKGEEHGPTRVRAWRAVDRAISAHPLLPHPPSPASLGPILVPEVRRGLELRVLHLVLAGDRPEDDYSEAELEQLGEAFVWLLALPVFFLGGGRMWGEEWNWRRFDAYGRAMLQAIALATPDEPDDAARTVEWLRSFQELCRERFSMTPDPEEEE